MLSKQGIEKDHETRVWQLIFEEFLCGRSNLPACLLVAKYGFEAPDRISGATSACALGHKPSCGLALALQREEDRKNPEAAQARKKETADIAAETARAVTLGSAWANAKERKHCMENKPDCVKKQSWGAAFLCQIAHYLPACVEFAQQIPTPNRFRFLSWAVELMHRRNPEGPGDWRASYSGVMDELKAEEQACVQEVAGLPLPQNCGQVAGTYDTYSQQNGGLVKYTQASPFKHEECSTASKMPLIEQCKNQGWFESDACRSGSRYCGKPPTMKIPDLRR